ncbi:serine hydrolase domain-containing protein [Vibrio vulnificus]|uniref:serine hydrolase domain-containing protein n=1 Tax=Vibrio vulnificus TaxID=672 RepID=UPI001FAF49CE|nr:serine hydrolase domain-containing protein [Vibrio vulnificus]MCJ0806210.1 beta-lactamase family protein [Vibrio vulnificus]
MKRYKRHSIIAAAMLTAVVGSAQAKESYTTLSNPTITEIPKGALANKSMEEVKEIQEFFGVLENRIKYQFPLPQTRYMWQNMNRMYITADVLRGGQISDLALEYNPSIGAIGFEKDGKTETVNSHLDNYPVDAFLVAHKGKIVFERYNTMRPQDKHIWMSSAKVIGSTVMALLEQQGKVDIKKTVPHYLPELKGTPWDKVTVEHALDMANGLDSTEHDEPVHDTRTNPKQPYYQWGVTLGIFTNPDQKETDPYGVLRNMKYKYPGHTSFEYNSINPFVINRINERVTGKPMNELLSEMIWSKIGAEHDMSVAVSPQGYPMFFGMVSSTLRDMARFGMIFTPSWNKVSQERIVPESVVKMIQSTGKPEMFGKGYVGKTMLNSFAGQGEEGLTNRYQWDAIFKDGDMYKGGVGGQGLYVSPSRDLVITWFSTGDGKNKEERMARAIAMNFDIAK